MKTFEIFHPIGGMYHDANWDKGESVGDQVYKKVAEVQAEDIRSVFGVAQNFNPQYEKHEIRSTSVGDIVRDVLTDESILILGLGERFLHAHEWKIED